MKQYGEGEYYHVYNRGANKNTIFIDDNDYAMFLGLLKSYLQPTPDRDAARRLMPNYSEKVELVAYCLMPNHFHMLLYLKETDGLEKLMRSLMTSYSMRFNKRHKHSGALFEGVFLASRITSDQYLWHVSKYIHLNPLDIGREVEDYPYSSIGYYLKEKHADWMHERRLVESEDERRRYRKDLAEQTDWHKMYHNLRHELANG